METSFRGCLFFIGIFPSRKTPLFWAADIENTFLAINTAFFLASDLHFRSQ